MIKLLVLDVDGVLTDGKIIYNEFGAETKNFHVRDGLGIKMAQKAGIDIAIISGRKSKVTELRANELKIEHVFTGVDNKLLCLRELCDKLGIDLSDEVAFIGDDINDISILKECAFSGTVDDAPEYVKKNVHFISNFNGGNGAVREFIEAILMRNGQWENIFKSYLA
ncbi:HAD-IIIA family hydrolase [Deferribacteraceae bacterium V6Fe1]|nr:HAD-IIIA family hydrolase [Deferribacteraceae bacterium V6Fe1]